MDRNAIAERLLVAEIAFGRLSTLEDLAAHPQLRTIAVETAAGNIEVIAPPIVISGETPEYQPVPTLGQHDEAVREEFSITADASIRPDAVSAG